MPTPPPKNLTTIACKSLSDAQTQASQDAIDSAALVVPATFFSQAGRAHLSTALPVATIASRLVGEAPDQRGRGKKKSLQPSLHRPVVKDHVAEIVDYLRQNQHGGFVIPPLTVAAIEPVRFYTTADEGRLKLGFAVIPAIRLIIIDGAHRHAALCRLLDELEPSDPDARQCLLGESVGVVIRFEDAESAVNQAFADASKCRPLPLALLAPFDLRDPLNRLVIDLERECPLLHGRIDSTTATLGFSASAMFINRHLRAFVQAAITGEPTKDEETQSAALDAIATEKAYRDVRDRLIAFINRLAERMEPWNRLLSGDATVQAMRADGYLNLTVAGLMVIGMAIHPTLKTKSGWTKTADALAALDWSKTAKIWQGNLIQRGRNKGRTSFDADAVLRAAAAISNSKR